MASGDNRCNNMSGAVVVRMNDWHTGVTVLVAPYSWKIVRETLVCTHNIVFSVKLVRTTVFLVGITLWVKQIRQGQSFIVDYVFVHLLLFKQWRKVPDMHLLPELLAQSFLYAESERTGETTFRDLAETIALTATCLPISYNREVLPPSGKKCDITSTVPAISFLNWSFLLFSPSFWALGSISRWSYWSRASTLMFGIWAITALSSM